MPWERIQQQTRQTRFSGAPVPSTVPDTQSALNKYSLNEYTSDDWPEGVEVTVVFLLQCFGSLKPQTYVSFVSKSIYIFLANVILEFDSYTKNYGPL